MERGLGDDQDRLGVFQEFIGWRERIYSQLAKDFPILEKFN